MGLDIVELVTDVEKRFGVRFANSELEKLRTVGDLHDMVLRELPNRPERAVCHTSRTFYKVRRVLGDMLGLARKDVRPSTKLGDLASHGQCQDLWEDLPAIIELDLPWLDAWKRIRLAALVLAMGTATTPLVLGWVEPWSMGFVFPLTLFGVIVYRSTLKLSAPVIWKFGFASKTVGDLAKGVVALNHERLANQHRQWLEQDVWNSLRLIVASYATLAAEEIRPEMSFVEDLGLD